ncbi:MAG: AAA family ATPase, partial [Deltaproteobacteria bacterium]|nr:AAA family ATPase [Deltaproteobacteria bacterium]
MHFSELVLQGVRNFQQMHRFPLGKGFTVFVGDSGAGKSTFVDVILHLLNPNPTEPATDKYKSSDPNLCRAALLIDDDAGQRYRLVQDLLRGSIALARQDPATSQFVAVSNSPAEIVQYLSSQLHLPQKDILKGIYISTKASLPSGMVGKLLGSGAPPMHDQQQSAQPGKRRGLPPSQHFQDDGDG